MIHQNGRSSEVEAIERLSLFELTGKLFGIDIVASREVLPLPENWTPLPNSGEVYRGVFNLRGEIFPLVDISPILGLTPKEILSDDMVILVEHEPEFIVGIVVDKVHGIMSYSPPDMKLPRGLVPRPIEPYVSGVVYHHRNPERNPIYVLDLRNIFRTKAFLAYY